MTLTFSFSRGEGWSPDGQLLRRIRSAYLASHERYRQPEGSMWGHINEKRRNIHDALMSDDDKALIDLLKFPSRTEMYYGIDLAVEHMVQAIRTSDGSRGIVCAAIENSFVAMAESLGAARLWYPESGRAREAMTAEKAEQILQSIDAIVGHRLRYPNPFEDEFGIVTSRGIIVAKTAMAIYLAFRLQTIDMLIGARKILEIGPGNGRGAYYCYLLGFTDYTTVDLPMGIVGQACFLAATLGADKIWMIGDDPSTQRGRIRLLPPFALEEGAERFDAILNVDSITEMPEEQSVAYLRYAATRSRAFISINHEFNKHTVPEIATMAGVSQRPLRSLSAIRPGYVEEIFLFQAAAAPARETSWLTGRIRDTFRLARQ